MKQERFFVVHMKDNTCQKIKTLLVGEQWQRLLTVLIEKGSS